MKTRNKLTLTCFFMAGVMLLAGCGLQNTGNQNNNEDKAASSNQVSKKETSGDLLSRAKFYDADGTCTMDIMYEYNEDGKEVHRVQQYYGDLEWTDESFCTYPDAFTRQQTFIDQNTGNRSQVDTITYNEDGAILTETSTDYRPDGTENIMRQIEYTYDKHGNLIRKEEHSTATVGHALNHISITEYTYDSDGNRLTEKLTSSSEGQEDKVFTDSEYQYDSKGNKIREISNLTDDHTYSPILYEYNGKDQLIKESDYASTAPDTLKQYFVYEYDNSGNRVKYSRYSPEDQLLSYTEYEYIKISELKAKGATTSEKDRLYQTWLVDGTASSTISFEFIDPTIGINCKIRNYDLKTQQEGIGGASSNVKATDDTVEISCGPDVYITFSYWFEADGALKMKDESTGNTISLHAQ